MTPKDDMKWTETCSVDVWKRSVVFNLCNKIIYTLTKVIFQIISIFMSVLKIFSVQCNWLAANEPVTENCYQLCT
jgi:hypothetical protein